ncbi:cytochrome P450 [Bisporella sp. PMI_857]|nr:cytochrome P450 [Bisporella sp. PMI_857]
MSFCAMSPLTLLGAFLFACLIAVYRWWHDPYHRMPEGAQRLPGPWNLPLIGRVHDLPTERTWLHFYKWAKEFGPIFKHELFGTTHVWIASEQIAKDLLAKQAAVFSDRPLINNLPINKTGGEYLPLLGENETWLRQRKFGHQIMTASARLSQHNYPVIETKRLLYKLLFHPDWYRNLLEEHTSRNICRLAWGSPDEASRLRQITMALLTVISPAGALPNVVSPLAYLPAFLSPWKRYEKRRYAEERDFFLSQQAKVRKQWLEGKAKPCYMKMFFDSQEKSQADDLEGAYEVGMMAIAGALTIASPLMSFILAVVLHPEWLAKLQDEIDIVCGDRLPEMGDMENLPVLRSVVKEVIRWRPPVPTGIPHASSKDHVYDGFFIPAGSTIHAMEWGITRDANIYPMPDSFLPQRWMSPSYPTFREPLTQYPRLEGHSQFGNGRRIYDNGREVDIPDLDYCNLLIAKPDWFQLDMTPRNEVKRQKMMEMWRRWKLLKNVSPAVCP